MRQNLVFVLSAPSGTGKTSLAKELIQQYDDLTLSVSATTRPARSKETHEKDYFFMQEEQFKDHKNNGFFIESAKIFDYHYGTPWPPLKQALLQGKDVICNLNWEGAQRLRDHPEFHNQVVTIFLVPPSEKELRRRLEERGQDDPDVIQKRLSTFSLEISCCEYYDYVIYNTIFAATLQELTNVIHAERLRRVDKKRIAAALMEDLS